MKKIVTCAMLSLSISLIGAGISYAADGYQTPVLIGSAPQTLAHNWTWIHSTDIYSKYIDKNSIQYQIINGNQIKSATVWIKSDNINTHRTIYAKINLDFQGQVIHLLQGRVDVTGEKTVEYLNKKTFPALPTEIIYSDYYYYFLGYLQKNNLFEQSLSKNKFWASIGQTSDKNGKVSVFYADKSSIRVSGDQVSCYLVSMELDPNNHPYKWRMGQWSIYMKAKKLAPGNTFWYRDLRTPLTEMHEYHSMQDIMPNSLGERLYNFLVDYVQKNPIPSLPITENSPPKSTPVKIVMPTQEEQDLDGIPDRSHKSGGILGQLLGL